VGISPPKSNSIDITSEKREAAYTYYDVTNHDLYTKASNRGIDISMLPPPKQHVVWKSKHEKGVLYPESREFISNAENSSQLEKLLEAHTDNLVEIDTGQESIDDDVADRLEQMGYLKK